MFRRPLRRGVFSAAAILAIAACNTTAGPSPTIGPEPTATNASASAIPAAATAAPGASSVGTKGVIAVDPPEVELGEPVSIHLSGFPPNHEVTVRATTVGAAYPNLSDTGLVRGSEATFTADGSGAVDVASATPVSGSYDIANAMGLFWSMHVSTVGAEPPPPGAPIPLVQYRYELTAEVDGTDVARASVVQDMGSPDVTVKEISEGGLLGQFYMPPGPGPFPAVIVLSGSGGGLTLRRPKIFAADGYAVLSLPYFNYTSPIDGTELPTSTVDLPMEYFGKAIDWLQAQPGVNPDRIGIYGTSLGGQVALLVGARYPAIKSVIAIAPPTVTWDGGTGHSSFSFKGKPVPYVVPFGLEAMAQPFWDAVAAGQPYEPTIPPILAAMKAAPDVASAVIKVEEINGPVLIVSGTDDTQLPSVVYGELAMDRLKTLGFKFPYRHIVTEGAGHLIDVPDVDRSLEIAQGGGNPEANELAAEAMWPVVLEYLGAMK